MFCIDREYAELGDRREVLRFAWLPVRLTPSLEFYLGHQRIVERYIWLQFYISHERCFEVYTVGNSTRLRYNWTVERVEELE